MENTFGAFMVGVIIGILITILIAVFSLSSKQVQITTNQKIIPEWKLTTDGKVVDTLYIYKQK